MNYIQLVPTLDSLPRGLQHDGAISIALEEGVPVLRASQAVQERIEELLYKQQHSALQADEEQELEQYEAVDDYLSYVNRLTRNLAATPPNVEEDRAA